MLHVVDSHRFSCLNACTRLQVIYKLSCLPQSHASTALRQCDHLMKVIFITYLAIFSLFYFFSFRFSQIDAFALSHERGFNINIHSVLFLMKCHNRAEFMCYQLDSNSPCNKFSYNKIVYIFHIIVVV